jgi:hypothetical protein
MLSNVADVLRVEITDLFEDTNANKGNAPIRWRRPATSATPGSTGRIPSKSSAPWPAC